VIVYQFGDNALEFLGLFGGGAEPCRVETRRDTFALGLLLHSESSFCRWLRGVEFGEA